MSLDAIRQITDAEQRARDITEDAKARARELLLHAQQTADGAKALALDAASQNTADMLLKAKDAGAKEALKERQLAAEQCELLRQKAEKNMGAAVSLIVAQIAGE